MKSNYGSSRGMMILSMVIFSTIGILRRYIPYSSSIVALIRGILGTLFLLALLKIKGKSLSRSSIRENLVLLILSGTAIGFNWIFLFEAYTYTSVATATLCYYLAPILVILFSPIVLKEKLTPKKLLCAAAALIGITLVSGVLDPVFRGESAALISGDILSQIKGVLFGLAAAVLYCSVILMNKLMKPIPSYDKTILQLAVASAALLPYVLLTEDFAALSFNSTAVILLLIAGVVHTGFAYWLYFGSMEQLKAQTVALLSYIDPILAVVLSMLILHEPMTISAGIGAVLILGASVISEK